VKNVKSISLSALLLFGAGTSFVGCSDKTEEKLVEEVKTTQSEEVKQQGSKNNVEPKKVTTYVKKTGEDETKEQKDIILEQLDWYIDEQEYEKVVSVLRSYDSVPQYLFQWLKQRSIEGHVMLQFEYAKNLVAIDQLETAKWFSIGYIGAKIDSNLCASKDAHTAYQTMKKGIFKYAAPILEQHPEYTTIATDYAIKWHEEHFDRPNPEWICLRAVKHFTNDLIVYKEDHWPAVHKMVLDQMRNVNKSQKEKMAKQK